MNYSHVTKDKKGKEIRVFDLNLLKTVLSVQSTHDTKEKNEDSNMIKLVHSVLTSISTQTKAPIETASDSYGNIYITKGKTDNYPCVVAHLDTVHAIVPNYRVYQQNDILFAFSDATKTQVGIGGDDKVGIFVALQALLDIPNIKVVLFRNKEIGRIGSRFSINNCSDFYKDCNFILQCDRKGNYDFLTKSAGVKMTSAEFENAVAPLLKKYDFISSEAGIATDVDVLVENGVGVCAANISSGYYSPHTDKETVSVYNIGRAYSLVYDICDTFKNKKFLYKYVKPVHKHSSYSSRSSYSTYNTGNYEDTNKTSKLTGVAPFVRDAYDEKYNLLPGCFTIVTPIRILTKLRCKNPECNGLLHINTVSNSLWCSNTKCGAEGNSMYPDWYDTTEITLVINKTARTYVYSWMYDVWVLKTNAVYVKQNNLNFWISKEIYEKEWKDIK